MKLPLLFKLIFCLIIFAVIAGFIFERSYKYPLQIKFGVTFSPGYARYLKLDWQKTYLAVLDELKVKNLRIPTYWNSLAPKENEYDFSDTDFMLSEAVKREVKVILVLGIRQPRWPECYIPLWAKQLSYKQKQEKVKELIKQVVTRYKANKSVWAWQVENEPFAYWFGECDRLDKKFLQEEIGLVKSLDHRPIMLTDSGEWGSWTESLNSADVLGISIYRKVYNSSFNMYLTYPFPAGYYNLKGKLTKKLTKDRKIIVSELQMEPWLAMKNPEENTPIAQIKLFSADDFKANIEFVKKTGFDEIYLWGVEWWYFMDKNGSPQYLDYVKTLF